ncbi:unnamed protein product [Cuscuta europaea]|uniref:Uncharacterized protein n=1 Tax=Cuscuta europaea TaxID=41803 RepID=A0A9P0YPJ2_CUSEU|nr:unnamed protein product [Cuscuta europaea]
MFDQDGFSLNLAGTPSGSIIDTTPPDPFFVYVESCLPDCSYRQLYCPPHFCTCRNRLQRYIVKVSCAKPASVGDACKYALEEMTHTWWEGGSQCCARIG